MNSPKQLRLPLKAPRGPTLHEVMARLARMEARLVRLMKHQGMTHDGGGELPEDKEAKRG